MMQTENVLNDSRLRALENHTRVNLLRPTLGTKTINGVTCTNNGDGTYTLNGTASSNTYLSLCTISNIGGKRLVGCFVGGGYSSYYLYVSPSDSSITDFNDLGSGVNIPSSISKDMVCTIKLKIASGYTCNNLLFKPMLTTDLTATYDDFVSYEDSFAINRNAAQKQDVLTYEEIQASTDLSGKIASASSLKTTYDLISSIFANDGRHLTSNDDMNNITEGVYRQGGTSLPANSPSAPNAYILVLKRNIGADYNNVVYFQIWMSVNINAIYFRSIAPNTSTYKEWVKL